MSESPSSTVSLIATNSLGVNDSRLEINGEESSSTAEKTITDTIRRSSLSENITDEIALSDLKLSTEKTVERKYPFTEKSKREMAAKIRTQREKEFDQIKKINETITHGAEVIKNRWRTTLPIKIESLKKINNSQWYLDRNIIYDGIAGSLPLIKKIEALESNLKKLEDDMIMEKNDKENYDTTTVKDNQKHITFAGENCDSDIISAKETIKNDISNSTAYLECEDKYGDSSDKYVYEVVHNTETRLTFNPKYIQFRITSVDLSTVKDKQQIKVGNRSKITVLCRYSHLSDPNSVLLDSMDVIKVKSVAWCRLQPGLTIDYPVTFRPIRLPNSRTYTSLKGVHLVFETASNNRPDVKCAFRVPIRFCAVKPEPVLVTKTISFPAVHDSTKNIQPKKYLILKNNSGVECVFSVFTETDYYRNTNIDTDDSAGLNSVETVQDNNINIFRKIITTIICKTFQYFVWKNHIKVLLPANGTVKVPVVFNHNFAYSSISENYIIAFDNTDYVIPNERVNVIGHIRYNIFVKPNVIDVGLCYLTSSVQVVSFKLHSNSRVVVPFEVKIPRELCKHVELSQTKGYLKAGSSLEISLRICLKLNIIRADCSMYFNGDTGFLDFPVRVHPSNSRKHYEVRVLAVVTTPLGLKLTPGTMDFGTVNTTETVVRIVTLTNRSRTTMVYGFLKLPERVSILPNAFGSILSGENVFLHVHYSPRAIDLPKNAFTFEDDFKLTCSTVAGLNAEKSNSNVNTAERTSRETITEEMQAISNTNQTSTIRLNEIKELDHGADKIEIVPVLNDKADVNSLDENSILKEATVECHARIHDIPVELSVQKIVFGNTSFTSYSTHTIELRASNLASTVARNTNSYPDFKIRFEFCSKDPCIEFKPNNGILQSKEVIKIIVILRPKLNDELENILKECVDSEVINNETERILEDKNSFINEVYDNRSFPYEQVKMFEANTMFYCLMLDKVETIAAVCFVQFVNRKSIEYFGFDTESLKLSLVCPITKPKIVLFTDRINFGKCTTDVRHNEWLLIRNITTDPVPLEISLPNPVGPFFCAFALNGQQLLLPGRTTPINISFVPERETTENEILEVTSGTMRLTVKLYGDGVWPSCRITPDDTFNVIRTTDERLNNTFIFRVTNTSGVGVWFNVQMEWAKERSEPISDDEASELLETLRTWAPEDGPPPRFDGPDWTELRETGGSVFDLGNGGRRPLRFRLDPDEVRPVSVTFNPPAFELPPEVTYRQTVPGDEGEGEGDDEQYDYVNPAEIFWCRVYAAVFNVHVGRKVLGRFHVIGFVEMKPEAPRETP